MKNNARFLFRLNLTYFKATLNKMLICLLFNARNFNKALNVSLSSSVSSLRPILLAIHRSNSMAYL